MTSVVGWNGRSTQGGGAPKRYRLVPHRMDPTVESVQYCTYGRSRQAMTGHGMGCQHAAVTPLSHPVPELVKCVSTVSVLVLSLHYRPYALWSDMGDDPRPAVLRFPISSLLVSLAFLHTHTYQHALPTLSCYTKPQYSRIVSFASACSHKRFS